MKAAHGKKFQDVATKPTKHKQTNSKPRFFDTEYLPFEKISSWSDSNRAHFPSWAYSLPPV